MPLLLGPVLAMTLSVSASAHSELLVRTTADEHHFDSANSGKLTLSYESFRSKWQLSYSPSYTWLALGTDEHTRMLSHEGTFSCALRLTRRTQLIFWEYGRYGRENLRLAGLSSPTSVAEGTGDSESGISSAQSAVSQPRSVSYRVRTGTSVSGVVLSRQLSPRLLGTVRTTYSLSQGLGSLSRKMVPRAEATTGGLELTRLVTRRDRWSLGVTGSRTTTEPSSSSISGADTDPSKESLALGDTYAVKAWVLSTGPEWVHVFSRTIRGTLGTDVAFSQYRVDERPRERRLDLGGSAGIRMDDRWQKGELAMALTERYAPEVDRYKGIVVGRLSTTVGAEWTKEPFSCAVGGSWGRAVGADVDSGVLRWVYLATQSLSYVPMRHWTLEVGSRQSWFRYEGEGRLPMIWTVYLGVTFATGNARL